MVVLSAIFPCYLLDLGSAGEELYGLVVIVDKLSILVSCFLCYQLEKLVFCSLLDLGSAGEELCCRLVVIVYKLSIYFVCFVNSKVLVLVFRVVTG